MTDREKEILNAINEMGLFRTPYPNDEVSRLVSKLIKDKVAEFEKIKAEIEQDAFNDVNGSKYIFVNRVNQIIDKYKAELKGENHV